MGAGDGTITPIISVMNQFATVYENLEVQTTPPRTGCKLTRFLQSCKTRTTGFWTGGGATPRDPRSETFSTVNPYGEYKEAWVFEGPWGPPTTPRSRR